MANGRPAAHRGTVVIANGFMPFYVSLKHLATVYRAKGFDTRIIPHLQEDMSNVPTYAEHVVREVERENRIARGPVDIVCLSMGGVATLYAIKELGLAPKIRTFLAVGSPFHGSPIAFLGKWSLIYEQSGQQMMPGSDFLTRLHAAPLPDGPRYVSVGGFFDPIAPPHSTSLDGAKNLYMAFTHHDLLLAWLHCELVRLLIK